MFSPLADPLRFKQRYGPWALVTGASSGIGRALARELAAAGLNLVLVGRNRAALEALAAELQTPTLALRVLEIDLAQPTALPTIAEATRDLDVGLLIAAAGFGSSGPFLSAPLEQELELLQVNCAALMALSWWFGGRFVARGSGGLVLLSSIVAFQGTPYSAHYGASKAYVQALAEALQIELGPQGVDVLAAAPGPTHSGFAARAGMKMGQAMRADDLAIPILAGLGRRGTVLPGGLSKLLHYSLSTLPRPLRVRLMGRIMSGMRQS
ncbi:MAG: SDR family NAD(P)-dependent oxidoreductase [Candidatus Sericytochromatia bacterium]